MSVTKRVADLLPPELSAAYSADGTSSAPRKGKSAAKMSVAELERAMWDAVDKLDFERAAILRDAIAEREGRKPITDL